MKLEQVVSVEVSRKNFYVLTVEYLNYNRQRGITIFHIFADSKDEVVVNGFVRFGREIPDSMHILSYSVEKEVTND